MGKTDIRLEILDRARRSLTDKSNLSSAEREDILKLLNILIEALEKYTDARTALGKSARALGNALVQHQALLHMLRQQADELDTLKKLSLTFTSSLDLPTVLEAVVREAMRLVKNALTAHIFLYTNDKLEFGAALDADGNRNRAWAIPRSNGLTYSVARGGEIIMVENMKEHPLFEKSPPDWSGSIIGIPLKFNDTVVGVMNLSRSTVGGFTRSEMRLLELLADQAAVAISNASLHQLISRQAYSDTLTSLPNRRALDESLENEVLAARRNGYPFAVIMMDLDGFKVVNDTHGHDIGDQVLRALSNYLITGLRATDFLARYGGDEFTLILSQTDLAPAYLVAEKILEKLSQFSYPLPSGGEIKLELSGGIALYPIHAMTAADLLRAADEALYRAKKQKRGSFMVARGFTGGLPHEV